MSDKDVLISMGFEAARVDWALRATNNRGLQPAMDFILEHNDDPIPEPGAVPSAGSGSTGAAEPMDEDEDEDTAAIRAAYGKASANVASSPDVGDGEAKSIKCAVCSKVFKNTALANFHAEKSGHDQFEESTEEIKPLTEEEKKQKLDELREKMAEKRAKKAAQEAKEAQANETIRRKSGKDMGQIKEDMQAKQIAKEAEEKRLEKVADAKARAAVKAQIEQDKRERARRAAEEKARREGRAVDAAPAPAPAASASASTAGSSVAGRDFKDTRLQIRMASGGTPYTTTLPSDATLREVAEYLAGQTLAVDVETVNFAQHFPRKQFSHADFSRTLRELGLTPSAVLIAS